MNGNIVICFFNLQLFAYFAYFCRNFCFKKIFLTRFRSLIKLNFKKCSFKLSFTKSIASTNYGTANTRIIYLKKKFLSPSWRLGPKISLVRKITLAEWPREASHELINLIPRAEKLMRNCWQNDVDKWKHMPIVLSYLHLFFNEK